MQTFLPYASYGRSAVVLDQARLGKQRVEAVQILRTNLGLSTAGWQHHPAVRMWKGYESALWHYTSIMCQEWEYRGFRSERCNEHLHQIAEILDIEHQTGIEHPWWLGTEALHLSHRQNLVRKMPEHYGPLWPDVEPREGYVWPSTMEVV